MVTELRAFLHECSDRHAARIAFRHTETEPKRNPTYINYPFVLYFYQCLIEGDVRKHVKEVNKQIWLKNGNNYPHKVGLLNTPQN